MKIDVRDKNVLYNTRAHQSHKGQALLYKKIKVSINSLSKNKLIDYTNNHVNSEALSSFKQSTQANL